MFARARGRLSPFTRISMEMCITSLYYIYINAQNARVPNEITKQSHPPAGREHVIYSRVAPPHNIHSRRVFVQSQTTWVYGECFLACEYFMGAPFRVARAHPTRGGVMGGGAVNWSRPWSSDAQARARAKSQCHKSRLALGERSARRDICPSPHNVMCGECHANAHQHTHGDPKWHHEADSWFWWPRLGERHGRMKCCTKSSSRRYISSVKCCARRWSYWYRENEESVCANAAICGYKRSDTIYHTLIENELPGVHHEADLAHFRIYVTF